MKIAKTILPYSLSSTGHLMHIFLSHESSYPWYNKNYEKNKFKTVKKKKYAREFVTEKQNSCKFAILLLLMKAFSAKKKFNLLKNKKIIW